MSSAKSSTGTLPGRSLFDAASALTIAIKLEAEISEGRRHTNVVVRIDGIYIGRFGIRRNKNVGHDYIPRQIQTTTKIALGLARCTHYLQDYRRDLTERGKLPQ